MASTQLLKEVSSLQANTLLPALENCLLELDAACNAGREGMCGKGDAWLIACAALLEHSTVLAKASSFLQLEVTQLLQRHLDKRPRLAEALLCAQLQVFLQHPVALQQLLRAVPPNQPSQTLTYRSLCQCLSPGGNAMQWASTACKRQTLQMVRSCASWELQKLVTEPSGTTPGRVKLAGHLPWLLHLLLLTECAEPEAGDAPGSSYGSACDDDSAMTQRSEGTNHCGIPSSSPAAMSADHASSGGPMVLPTQGRQAAHRESANFSIISTSEPVSGVDSEVHGLHGDSGCLASVEPAPGADQAAFRAAATVLAHLRNGPSLCSLLGLPVDPGLDPCTSQDDLAHALSPLGPDAIGGAEESRPVLGLLLSGRSKAASDRASLQGLAVTQQLTEILLQALLQPSPGTAAILAHASSSPAADSAGRKGRDGTVDVSRESVVLDLLGLHMQLAGQHMEEQPGKAGEQTTAHIRTEALLVLLELIRAAMQKQGGESRRARRRSSSSHSMFKDGEGPQRSVTPEAAAHALSLLASAPELADPRGADGCNATPLSRDPGGCQPEAAPREGAPPDVVLRALASALAMYNISLAGPQSGVEYAPSQAAAALAAGVRRLRGQERIAGLESAATPPDSHRLGDALAAPVSSLLGKRERQERAQSAVPGPSKQPSTSKGGSALDQPAFPSSQQPITDACEQNGAPASEALAPAKKRRIAPEAVVHDRHVQQSGDNRPSHSEWMQSAGFKGLASSEYTGSDRGDGGEPDEEQSGDEEESGDEEASPLLQRGMLADQEKEAWWEHYIAVKLDLVENVLKDDVGPEQGEEGQIRTPIAADDVTTPMPGSRRDRSGAKGTPSGAPAACMPHRRMVVADLAFREPRWQAMHAAVLQLLTAILCRAEEGGGSEQREGIVRLLRAAAPEADVQASVRNACLLIQPSCGMDTYQAAIAGARSAPLEALPIYFAVRLGRYLSGSGDPPESDLAAAYLATLEGLCALAKRDILLSAGPPSTKKAEAAKPRYKQTPPQQLLAKLLLALLDCGDIAIGRMPPGADSTKRLIRLVLAGFGAPDALVLAASALVGLSQGMLDLKRRRPHWASAYDAGWHDAWFNAAETAEPVAAVAAAGQLLRRVAAGFAQAPGAFRVAADVVIMACRAAECWEGLDADEMEGTLATLLQLGAAVQAQCTAATAHLLHLLSSPPGREGADADQQGACDDSMAAAYAPDLAESLLGFCQWLSKTWPGFQSAQVADLERQAMLGCKAGHSMLLDHLAASAVEEADLDCSEAPTLQAQVCEWLGEAYEDMTAHGVASYESKPDQSLLHDSALTDHSMQTDRTEESTGDPKGGSQSNGEATKNRKRVRSSNPFVQAAMAEIATHWGNKPTKKRPEADIVSDDVSGDDVSADEDDDSGDDLDDFVVCKPGRDYRALFAQQFKYSCAEMPRSLFRRPL